MGSGRLSTHDGLLSTPELPGTLLPYSIYQQYSQQVSSHCCCCGLAPLQRVEQVCNDYQG